jgi:prophage regulatory protein
MSSDKKPYRRPVRILRVPETANLRGRSHSGHYADIQAGLFPPPVKTGPRASGHPENEVAAMIDATIAGKSADELRALVHELVAARQTAASGAQ